MTRLRIATRRSPLALWQTEHVAARLREAHPGLDIELVPLSTRGDEVLDRSLAAIGGKGLFLKELEVAMQRGEADCAVHSLKDVPMELEPGFALPAVLARADHADAFVSNRCASLDELPRGARVGTSSLRRQAQLRALRPDLELRDLRGNVNTRLARLDAGEYDAIVLAASGLKRLGLTERIRAVITPEESLPAVGQGALGIECRIDDPRVNALIAPLRHEPSQIRVTAERAMSARLQGSCQVPMGAYALIENGELYLRGLVGTPDGKRILRGEIRGALDQAEELGTRLGDELLARGGGEILAALQQQDG